MRAAAEVEAAEEERATYALAQQAKRVEELRATVGGLKVSGAAYKDALEAELLRQQQASHMHMHMLRRHPSYLATPP